MADLIIKNGYIYDPLNGVDGEKYDIHISKGKIVDEVGRREAKIIDASNMIVMPGGVDLHSHIAGSKINIGRAMRPEDHRKDVMSKTSLTRAGVGYSCPSTFYTGYRYAQIGYTTVFEPAMPPLSARHVHEELNDIPIIDKGAFTLMGNNYFVLKYVKSKDLNMLKGFMAWLLKATRGYAVKIVNPGGVENWKWGKNVGGLDDLVYNFEVTPREIITSLAKVNEELGLPHTIHLHCNNLGVPGNWETTIESMKSVESIKPSERRTRVVHVVHCQFNALDGENWVKLKSGAYKIAKYVNEHNHATIDLGQVLFTDTTTMTGDGPWQFRLHNLTGNKWVNSDVEMEAGAGVVPYTFRKENPANAIQWAIGLELALMVYDPWKISMTTDHPNGGSFIHYPKVISWLMSRKARTDTMLELNRSCIKKTGLAGIYREYDFNEIAIITRAAPSMLLGLKNKGHLGVGADGDVSIFNVNPMDWRPSMYRDVENAFSRAAFTIKNGEVVVKNGEITATPLGKTFWVDAKVSKEIESELLEDLQSEFKKIYTVSLNNYPVQDAYLPLSKRVEIETGGCLT